MNGRFNDTHSINMKSHLYSLKPIAAVCIALALSLSSATAQKGTPPATTQHYALEVTAEGFLIHDGKETSPTLGHAIDILRQQHPELTFALSPGLSEVRLSELKLRADDVDQTLEALRLACGNRFVFAAPSHMPDKPDSMRTLYLLQGDEPRNRRRTVEAFNLGPWIASAASQKEKEKRLDQLTELINLTMEKLKQSPLDPAERPETMFHMDANIIVVIGSPDAIEVVGKLVRALSPGPFIDPATGLPGMGAGSFGSGGSVGNSTQPGYPHPNRSGGGGLPADPAQSGGTGSLTPAPNKPGSGASRQ